MVTDFILVQPCTVVVFYYLWNDFWWHLVMFDTGCKSWQPWWIMDECLKVCVKHIFTQSSRLWMIITWVWAHLKLAPPHPNMKQEAELRASSHPYAWNVVCLCWSTTMQCSVYVFLCHISAKLTLSYFATARMHEEIHACMVDSQVRFLQYGKNNAQATTQTF